MPLRPQQNFALIVASLVFVVVAESAVLFTLSKRPNTAPAPQITPQAVALPTIPPPVFTAPGVEPPAPDNSPPASQGALNLAPKDTPPQIRGTPLPPNVRAKAKALFDAANAALAKGDKKAALAGFQQIVKIAPDHLPTRLNLAMLYLASRQPEAALPHLRKAAQLDPKSPAPRFELARALLQLKRPAEALGPLQEVVKLAPKEPEARGMLAQVYLSQKKPALAYAQIVALAHLDPHNVEAQLQAANFAGNLMKKPDEAEKWLRLAAAGSPKDPRPALFLAQIRMARGDAKSAAQILAKAVKANPQIFDLYLALANARMATKDYGGARSALQTALQRLPKGQTDAQKAQISVAEGNLRLSLGRVLGESKKPKEARDEFQRAALLLPRDPEAQRLLATAAVQSGDTKGAIEALQKSLAIAPKAAGNRLFLAQILARNKDYKGANTQFEAYTKLQPRDARALIDWAQMASLAKDAGLQLQIWAKLATIDPKNPFPQVQRGILFRDLKRPAEALTSFQNALALKPNDPNAMLEIARLETQLKKTGDAADTWKKLIASQPNFVPAYTSLLQTSAQSGNATGARLFLARQMAKTPENPKVLSEILRFYDKSKQNSQAKALLSDLVQRNPKAKLAKAALDSFEGNAAKTSSAPEPTETPKSEIPKTEAPPAG